MIVVTAAASSPRASHTAIPTGPAGRTLVRDAEAESSEPQVPAIASLAARLLTVLFDVLFGYLSKPCRALYRLNTATSPA